MGIKEVVGIDASKLELDCYVHGSGARGKFGNDLEGIDRMVGWSLENCTVEMDGLLFVFEHTGLYTHQLIQYLGANGYLFQVVPGLEIKRSMGIARGKDDRADAKRIALYGYRKREEIRPCQLPQRLRTSGALCRCEGNWWPSEQATGPPWANRKGSLAKTTGNCSLRYGGRSSPHWTVR